MNDRRIAFTMQLDITVGDYTNRIYRDDTFGVTKSEWISWVTGRREVAYRVDGWREDVPTLNGVIAMLKSKIGE